MSSLFIDMHQYRRIDQAEAKASRAENKANQFEYRIDELERRANRTALACQALWEILSERLEISIEDVYERMKDIDLRDGKTDGKIKGQVTKCQNCGRAVNSAHPKCVYCGYKNMTEDIVS